MSCRVVLLSISLLFQISYATAQTLEQRLLTEPASKLALAAAASGDAARGAIVFHQPYFACTQCHAAGHSGHLGRSGDDTSMLGPD
jgi:cytochrome c5